MLPRALRRIAPALPLALAALTAAPAAGAFCGFYVAGADAKLFNNATMVVLMRDGTRTVLSMQNNYQGPPQDFAMVVPVPVVLQKENVKTLPDAVFARVDQLAAPRLVEYWEQDPCSFPVESSVRARAPGAPPAKMAARPSESAADLGVTIEAQFEVGEYEVVVLSAKDSLGLDTWLRLNQYKIPEGAEPILKPYVEAGTKFFVAKVNAAKVTFKDGMAKLSPLRFHYDEDKFTLPVRLGLLNSSGKQDLIVHILARGKRYELANYKNVTIPTNLDVEEGARDRFGPFYAALFDRTLEENPGAIVTEYAWDAGSCDPCPTPPLSPQDLATLGADALPGAEEAAPPTAPRPPPPPPKHGTRSRREIQDPLGGVAPPRPPPRPRPMWAGGGFVLTRLHARYGRESLGEDLVFREAKPIMGGREFMAQDGKLETGARDGGINNFQGRYAVRHPWTGPITCDNPVRGRWGGPPDGAAPQAKAARDLAFAPRGEVQLASLVRHDVPEVGLKAAKALIAHAGDVPGVTAAASKPAPSASAAPATSATPAAGGGSAGACGCATPGAPGAPAGRFSAALAALAALLAGARTRRGSRQRGLG